jgi:hypothetical protein
VTAFDWEDDDDWKALSLTDKAAMLKTTITMTELVELCGHDVNHDKVRPPWNPIERTPSTHLYEDHFYDYGSGRHGDIFDWIAEEHIAAGEEPASLSKRVAYVRRLALKGGKEPGDVDTVPVRKLENLDVHLLFSNALPYDFGGFPTAQYGVMKDHNTGDIMVPHWEYTEDGYRVYGIKIRLGSGGKSSIPGSQFTHRLYDPDGWPLRGRRDRCIITEGESDCWAMIEATRGDHVDVFALPSGSSAWKDAWLKDLESYREIRLCFDNDRAGKEAFDKVTRKVGFDRARELRVPYLYNDAREAIEAGWEPKL